MLPAQCPVPGRHGYSLPLRAVPCPERLAFLYFLAEPCGGKEKKQDEEISEMHWADILEALALITYDNDAVLFRKAMRFLKNQEDE